MDEESRTRYQAAQAVTVSVCPDDPTQSVLRPGIAVASYFFLAGGLLAFGVGVWFLLSYFGIEISL